MAKKAAGNTSPCHIVVGEWEISKGHITNIIKDKLAIKSENAIHVLEGSEITIGELMEKLATKGLFASKKAVIVKDFSDIDKKEIQEKICAWVEGEAKAKTKSTLLFLHICPENFGEKKTKIKGLMKLASLIDLSISGKKDSELKSLIHKYLMRHEKTIEPSALDLFLELVGNVSTTAIKRELEKLVSSVGKGQKITYDHVSNLVFRHQDKKIYNLTDAIINRNLEDGLLYLDMLMEQEINPLAILSGIRNRLLQLLALKTGAAKLSDKLPANYNDFKVSYWPNFKDKFDKGPLKDFCKLHPFPAFNSLKAQFSIEELTCALEKFARLDLELKISKLDPHLILEQLIIEIIQGKHGQC